MLFIATSNKGKLAEIQELLEEFYPEFAPFVGRAAKHAPEVADDFIGNAMIKALALQSEMQEEGSFPEESWILADDSGLCIDALNGEPGLLSARYAGDHVPFERHIQKVVTKLSSLRSEGVTEPFRARYVCALTLVRLDLSPSAVISAQGECWGEMLLDGQGESGFGYDPIFFVPEFGKTMAQLDRKTKNVYSHRRRAFEKLKQLI